MSKRIYLTLPKIHKACGNDSYRPVLCNVLVTKDKIIATDAYILAVHKTSEVFSEDFIKEMPDRFLIKAKVWAEICKPHLLLMFDKDKNLIRYAGKDIECYYPIQTEEKVGLFPNWEAVIPTLENLEGVNKISFKVELISNLKESLCHPSDDVSSISLTIESPEKAILVKIKNSASSAYGIIMPCI